MIRIEHLPADILGLTPLQRAALSGKLDLSHAPVARRVDAIARPRERFVPDERAHLAKWLEAQVTSNGPHVAALDSIRSLAQTGATCVLCTLRPALLGGPLRGLWQVLQTIKLAEALRASWKTPVIPVVWNLADDHHTPPANRAFLLNRNYDVQKIHLANLSTGRAPLAALPLEQERHRLGAVRAVLSQLFGDYSEIERAIDIFAPRDGETLPGAMTRALYDLLGHTGLVVVEPDWLREDLSRTLAHAIGARIQPPLRNGLANFEALGFDAQVDIDAAAIVHHVDAGGRTPLRAGGEGYCYDDEPGSRTRSELAAEIVQEPGAWHAGELLRPLVRETVLPVAACVGDDEELTAHLILGELRKLLGAPTPAFVPRVSVTGIDGDGVDSLERMETDVEAVLRTRGTLELAPEALPDPELLEDLREVARKAKEELRQHKPRLVELDRALGSILKRSTGQIETAVSKLAEKVQRVQSNRTGKSLRHLRRLNHGLCPNGAPQEDVFGPFPWVARFGSCWIDEFLAQLDPFTVEHLVLYISGDEEVSDPGSASL